MKLKHNLCITKKLLCLAAVSLAMTSCSILDGQASAGVERTPSSPQASTAAIVSGQSGQLEIPLISNAVSSEQQELIDAINRDGQTLQFDGFQDNVPVPVQTSGPDILELNYEQVDLRLILEELAQALDISIVIDPSIDDKVSIRTSQARPLSRDDIWPVIRMLSRDAGVLINRVGNVYNARKGLSNLPVEIVTPETLGQGTAARIMQITPLTYISSAAATEVIQPLLAPDGDVRTLSSNNTLAISASESQLQRVNELLFLIDSDPFANQGIHLYQLYNANAVEVADELTEILQLIEGTTPAYQVKGIERINAILVTAPASRGFEEISRWVKILDADGQEQVEQLFYYEVKNLIATELAETLSNVFEEEDDDAPVGIARGDTMERANTIFESDGVGGRQVREVSNETISSAPSEEAVSANLTVKIVADEATNSLLIRSTARDYRQLLTTINQLDAVPLQVMINAVIAQITLTDATEFGVDWSRVAANSSVNTLSTNTSTNFLPGGGVGGLMFSKSFIDGAAQVDATLEAISTNNEVQLLARPSLTVVDNQEGEIQIGSQVPFEQGESIASGGIATTNIGYRDTGIVLSITPQINNDGIVNLIIRQELSSVNNSAAGVNGNPIFDNQEINTTVVVRNGENVVLGGLIQTDTENLNTGIPGLNRVPILGKLFSYRQDKVERRELFIVLRPEIINLNGESGLQYQDILDRFDMVSDLIQSTGI